MTKVIEYMDCYLEKQSEINDLSAAISKHQSNVDSIEYQLWAKEFKTDTSNTVVDKEEFIIINYKGGAKSILPSSGNSFSANCRLACEYLDHGYYNTVRYDQVVKSEYERII